MIGVPAATCPASSCKSPRRQTERRGPGRAGQRQQSVICHGPEIQDWEPIVGDTAIKLRRRSPPRCRQDQAAFSPCGRPRRRRRAWASTKRWRFCVGNGGGGEEEAIRGGETAEQAAVALAVSANRSCSTPSGVTTISSAGSPNSATISRRASSEMAMMAWAAWRARPVVR